MTQRRIWNYGDTFTSEKATTSMAALHSPGVYAGYEVSIIDTDTISLSPGFLLLPSGILVGETSAIEMTISPLPAAATNYTIVVRHTDADVMGGQAAVYGLEAGLIPQSSLSDGVALAWIRYPGGAVPLQDFFVLPSRHVSSSSLDSPQLVPSTFLAPFSTSWVVSSLGANTSVADVYSAPNVVTSVATDGLGPIPPGFETSVFAIPLVAGRFRPVSIIVRSVVDPNSELSLSLLDTDGNPVTLSGFSLGPSAIFSDRVVSVDPSSGVFTDGSLYTMLLTFYTPALDSIELQSVRITYDPLP